MKSKILSVLLFIAATIVLPISFQNCSKSAFSTKEDVLSGTNIFSSSSGFNQALPPSKVNDIQQEENGGGSDSGDYAILINGSGQCDASKGFVYDSASKTCKCPANQAAVSGQCRPVTPGTLMFGGDYQCFSKNSGNKETGGVVADASDVIMVVAPGANYRDDQVPANIIYQTNRAANGKTLKQDILDNNGYTAVTVPPGANGDYTVIFYDPSYNIGMAQQFTDPSKMGYYIYRTVSRGPSYLQSVIHMPGSSLANMTFVLNWMENNDPRCEGHLSSPLVIDMRKEINKTTKGISLTSQVKGILYDILGLNSTPVAYTKKQISWFNNPEKFMFLALPDQNGAVNGINQLFGDNTKGPDGMFPANGYQALAKYDFNKDGTINLKDSVFAKLRLWGDLNKNGQAELSELFTMDEVGLVSIDLKYDASYSESDAFGNQTKMKSVVQFKNGAMRLIFDLWFRHN